MTSKSQHVGVELNPHTGATTVQDMPDNNSLQGRSMTHRNRDAGAYPVAPTITEHELRGSAAGVFSMTYPIPCGKPHTPPHTPLSAVSRRSPYTVNGGHVDRVASACARALGLPLAASVYACAYPVASEARA